MKKILVLLFWLLICATVWGQIDVPKEIPLGDPIVAKVNATIPEGAILDGGWKVGNGVKFVQVDKNTLHLWVAKTGTYKVTFSGFWLNIKEVKFKDGDGNEVIIQSYLGHGFVNEEAEFKVTGTDPPGPDPDPNPPNPAGPWQIMMFYEGDLLDNYSGGQRALLTSLKYKEDLEKNGNVFLEVLESAAINSGSAKYKSFLNAAKGKQLPLLAIAPKNGGDVLTYPLPENYDKLVELLNNPPAKGGK